MNRSTVLRSIKAGRISATKDELRGAWLIEPAELHRLYPPVGVPDANQVAVANRALSDAATDALVAELRDQLAEMRAQRDAWQGVAERIAREHAQPKAGKPAETAPFHCGAGCGLPGEGTTMALRAWMKREQWLVWIAAAIVLTMVLAAIGYLSSSV